MLHLTVTPFFQLSCHGSLASDPPEIIFSVQIFLRDILKDFLGHHGFIQGLVKGAILCFRNLYFYIQQGESTSTASQLTSPASQKSKDLNKVSLLLQDLAFHSSNKI